MENKNGETALMAAARAGRTAVCEALLAAGAELQYENNYGHTCMTLLAKEGNADMLKELKRMGADLAHETTFGNTVLQQVGRRGVLRDESSSQIPRFLLM